MFYERQRRQRASDRSGARSPPGRDSVARSHSFLTVATENEARPTLYPYGVLGPGWKVTSSMGLPKSEFSRLAKPIDPRATSGPILMRVPKFDGPPYDCQRCNCFVTSTETIVPGEGAPET